ncbi:MAG: beta/alpha barrel domain-containing protein, partial [Deferrisomatales bacterium]
MSYPGAAKDRHLEACLGGAVEWPGGSGFERYRLTPDLPDFPFESIDTRCQVLGKRLALPLFASSLTGGGRRSEAINARLAEAAQELGIGMAVGSQRILFDHPELLASFRVRRWASDVLLFANLGLVHLNSGLTRDHCLRAVEWIEADALTLYVNPLHEVFQPAGSTDFRGLLTRLEELCDGFPYPVVVKVLGFGLPVAALGRLGRS